MEKLIIQEGHSVGLFKFGMNIEEVGGYKKHYIKKYNCSEETFQFDYNDEGQVVYIQLAKEHLKSDFECKFKGIDIFNTKAAKLVEYFDSITPYNRTRNAAMGYDYLFLELGLSFWRGNVCTEEYLESEEFKELIPENQEDTKRFLYFETVGFHKV